MALDRKVIQQIINESAELISARTAESYWTVERAREVNPAGIPNSLYAFQPWPLVVERANGAQIWDVDGNCYTDYHMGYGVMVTGHAHPLIGKAVAQQMERGSHFGFLNDPAITFSELLCERFQLEQCQLANSGTEATQLAIRIARAQTGRTKIIKVEGGYHGTHDPVMVSTHPVLKHSDVLLKSRSKSRSRHTPQAVPWGAGVPPSTIAEVVVVAFNDLDGLRSALASNDIACVILEPILLNVGLIMPEQGYLAAARELCEAAGALLILDEVKTGVAIAHGGAREVFGVQGHLHCFGKGIGGGLPIAAVAGSAGLLSQVSQNRAPHYSTFAGNPLSCAAGIIALRDVLTPDAYTQIEQQQRLLRRGIEREIERVPDLKAIVPAVGAKGTVVFTEKERFVDYRDYALEIDRELSLAFWAHMFAEGILLSPGQDEQWTLSVAHDNEAIEHYLGSLRDFCNRLT